MIITYFRSSSFNAWSFCQQQFFLGYVLGIRDSGNAKAEKGTISHKMLELLARKKMALQQNQANFTDREIGQSYDTVSFGPEQAADEAIAHYVPKSIHKHKKSDLDECRKWMYDALACNNGMFSPLKRTIISPETFFDFSIEEDWARYNYILPNGEKLDGYLSLKGTIDLTVQVDGHPDTIELIDWKSGRRIDWGTGEEKTWKKLRNDSQLRLYHYALTRLFPWAKHIIVTILFIRDGGPFSLDFSKDDLAITENIIRERFDLVRNSTRPKLNKSWRCKSFCHYGKNKLEGSNKTICEKVNQDLLVLGMDRVIKKHGKADAYKQYGSGGGVSNRDTKAEKTGR